MGITITDVKIVGMCSKCRKKGDEIMKDKTGRVYRDDELSCIGCALGGETKISKEYPEESFIRNYIVFKGFCTKRGIKDINEIIRLWEARLNSL